MKASCLRVLFASVLPEGGNLLVLGRWVTRQGLKRKAETQADKRGKHKDGMQLYTQTYAAEVGR